MVQMHRLQLLRTWGSLRGLKSLTPNQNLNVLARAGTELPANTR